MDGTTIIVRPKVRAVWSRDGQPVCSKTQVRPTVDRAPYHTIIGDRRKEYHDCKAVSHFLHGSLFTSHFRMNVCLRLPLPHVPDSPNDTQSHMSDVQTILDIFLSPLDPERRPPHHINGSI
jgi:hypothetical protein